MLTCLLQQNGQQTMGMIPLMYCSRLPQGYTVSLLLIPSIVIVD